MKDVSGLALHSEERGAERLPGGTMGRDTKVAFLWESLSCKEVCAFKR